VATGFQIDVDSSAFREIASLPESQEFCVLDDFGAVKAHAHDNATFDNDGPDERVWTYLTRAPGRQPESQIKKIQIEFAIIH